MMVMSLHLAVYDYQTIIQAAEKQCLFPRTNITLSLPKELIRIGFIFVEGSTYRSPWYPRSSEIVSE